jgi:hypothetical protein
MDTMGVLANELFSPSREADPGYVFRPEPPWSEAGG